MPLSEMNSYGKFHRLHRLFRHEGRVLILAMDHGIPFGDVAGLEDIEQLLRNSEGSVDAAILNKGMVDTIDRKTMNHFDLILKLNGISKYASDPCNLTMISTVEEALSYDATAVSFEFYIGREREAAKLAELSAVVSECEKQGIPLIAHIYPDAEKKDPAIISHCIRLGWEIGVDVVKTFYFQGMSTQLGRTRKPVIIAGGDRVGSVAEVESYVSSAISEGARGIAMGRNLWGWGKDSVQLIERVGKIVHGHANTGKHSDSR